MAVGRVGGGDAGFLTSPDGRNWTVRQRFAASLDRVPTHLVTLDGELMAFSDSGSGVPLVWRSSDGRDWSAVDSASWTAVWDGRLLFDVASGPGGLVAIGNGVAGEHDELLGDPVVVRSTDGIGWQATTLGGASDRSVVRDIIGLGSGYIVLGGEEVGPTTGMGAPRAWWSDDGLSWTSAALDGATNDDNQLDSDSAVAGANGVVARTQVLCAGCPPTADVWTSIDGRAWVQALAPSPGMLRGNGTRLILLATDEGWTPLGDDPQPYPGLTRGWTSLDGVSWTSLTLSHPMTDQLEAWWVVPDGIVYAGAQSFWFGTPTSP